LIKQYCHGGTGWNPGKNAYILKRYLNAEKTWKKQVQQFLKDDKYPLERGNEYAAYIINGFITGQTYQFNGNVLNKGLITNLPEDVCVEVPLFVNSNGFFPVSVGQLPPQLAILNSLNASSEKMAVEAALTGDAEMVFHSVAYDPLTAAVLDLKTIRKMTGEMLQFNKKYFKNFKSIKL
jgi:alpha-galactosidase